MDEDNEGGCLVAIGSLLDFLDDVVDLGDAPWVDSSALLLTGTTANVGSNVVEDGSLGDINHSGLTEGGGNGKLIFLKKSKVQMKSFYNNLIQVFLIRQI